MELGEGIAIGGGMVGMGLIFYSAFSGAFLTLSEMKGDEAPTFNRILTLLAIAEITFFLFIATLLFFK